MCTSPGERCRGLRLGALTGTCSPCCSQPCCPLPWRRRGYSAGEPPGQPRVQPCRRPSPPAALGLASRNRRLQGESAELVPFLRSFGELWWGALACPPHFLPLHPCPHPPSPPCRTGPAVHPPGHHLPHLPPCRARGLAGGRLPDGAFEVTTGWAATARGFLKTPVSVQGAAADWATLRALAVPPTGHSQSGPGRRPPSQSSADLRSPEGSSQPCIWPQPCPMAWLGVRQA